MSNNDKPTATEAKKSALLAKEDSSVNGNTPDNSPQKNLQKERIAKGSSELEAQDSPPPTVATKPVSPELPKQTSSTKKDAATKPVGPAPMPKGSSLFAAGEPPQKKQKKKRGKQAASKDC